MADCETCKNMWWFSFGHECHCLPEGQTRLEIIKNYPAHQCAKYEEVSV